MASRIIGVKAISTTRAVRQKKDALGNVETVQAVKPPPVVIMEQCNTLRTSLSTLKDWSAAMDKIRECVKEDVADIKKPVNCQALDLKFDSTGSFSQQQVYSYFLY